ncbi:MAG: FmdE family protein [Desulfovibrio sp.]
MSYFFSEEQLQETIRFHGHECPGLAIGIRASEVALSYFDGVKDLMCITETDMCGVDAIQFLTGCTFGKGNLIHRDYGKKAFSFYAEESGKGIRLVYDDSACADLYQELHDLTGKKMKGDASPDELKSLQSVRSKMQQAIMDAPAQSLFRVKKTGEKPRGAAILESLCCEKCKELTMESRTRRFEGSTYCIPCFQHVEQKI